MRQQIYNPGASHEPPVLAGRQDHLDAWEVTLNNLLERGRKGGKDSLIQGVRGVGKSALLTRFETLATAQGYAVVALTGGSGEPDQLAPRIRNAIELEVAEGRAWWGRALDRFDSMAVNVLGVGGEIHMADPPAGRHDTEALAKLLADFGHDMKQSTGGGLVLTIDEIQTVHPTDAKALGYVLNHLSRHHAAAPVILVGAGLPDTYDRLRGPRDNPYITNPERLFRKLQLEPQLTVQAAAAAVVLPAREKGATWEPEAVAAVLELSGRYPAHLQSFAAKAWEKGTGTETVTMAHVREGAPEAAADIESEFLVPRWSPLTPTQAEYITAIAVCGGRAKTGQIAAVLDATPQDLTRRRQSLIQRGEIFAPERGVVQLAFPAMREYALQEYPQLEADREDLTRPSRMEKNLEAWRQGRIKTKSPEAFQPSANQAYEELTQRAKAIGEGGRDVNDPDQLPPTGMTNLRGRGPSLS